MYIICQLFGLGKAVLRTFIIELIYDGDCFKCWKYYYSVSHSAMMESALSVVIFIILYGSFMQYIVLFSVIQLMYVMLALFCITKEQNKKKMKMPTASFDCLHLYWPNSVGRVIVSYYTFS